MGAAAARNLFIASYGTHLFGGWKQLHSSKSLSVLLTFPIRLVLLYWGDPRTREKHMDGPGRPTLYKSDFAAQAHELCQAGATNQMLADFFNVSCRTIDNWLYRRPEFARSVKRGRELADARVACGLYSRAV